MSQKSFTIPPQSRLGEREGSSSLHSSTLPPPPQRPESTDSEAESVESQPKHGKVNKSFKDKETEKDEDEREEDSSHPGNQIETFEYGDMVVFLQGLQCKVGFVQRVGPKGEDRILEVQPVSVPDRNGQERNRTILQCLASHAEKNPKFFINKRDAKGTLWCQYSRRLKCLDPISENEEEGEEEASMTEVPSSWLPLLFACEDYEERLRAVLSGQLKGLTFKADEEVMVASQRDLTNHPDDDLDDAKITELKDGRILLNIEEMEDDFVTIGQIFHPDYVGEKHDTPWSANQLGSIEGFSKDDLVIYKDDNEQRQVGRILWIGQVPWKASRLVGIEKVTNARPRRHEMNAFPFGGRRMMMMGHMMERPRFKEGYKDSRRMHPHYDVEFEEELFHYRGARFAEVDERFINYVKVLELEEKHKAKLLEMEKIQKIDSLLINSEGYLWYRSGKETLPWEDPRERDDEDDEEEEEEKEEKKEEEEEAPLTEVPSFWLPLLLACGKLKDRMRAALSGQLDGLTFQPGEQVLVASGDRLTGNPDKDLKAAKITRVENGRIVLDVESGFQVTVECIFREDYCINKPGWHKNLLPCEDLELNSLVISQNRRDIVAGRLLWMGRWPGLNEPFYGIECITFSNSFEDQRFLNYVSIMDAEDSENLVIISGEKLKKIDNFQMCVQNGLESAPQFSRGSLWCACGSELICFDFGMYREHQSLVSDRKTASDSGAEFEVLEPHLAQLLTDCDANIRVRTISSLQLEGVKFEEGEKVLTPNYEKETGVPEDLIEATIKGIRGHRVLLNEDDHEVEVSDIFSKAYVERSDLPWTKNLLNLSEKFSKDELVMFHDDHESYYRWNVGKLLWMGALPWEDDEIFCIERLRKLKRIAPPRKIAIDSRFFADEGFIQEDSIEDSFMEENEAMSTEGMTEHVERRSFNEAKPDYRFICYKRIADAKEKEKVLKMSCRKIKKIDSFLLATEAVDIESFGSLWTRCGAELFCLDDVKKKIEEEEKEEAPKTEVSSIRLPFLLACENREDRTRAALSGQLDGLTFQPGEQVLVAPGDRLTGNPDKDLKAAKITRVENGRIVLDTEKEGVTVDRIFHKEYQMSDQEWIQNILPKKEEGKLITFVEEDQCHIGHLNFKGRFPWSSEMYLGIECLKEDSFENGHPFVNYLRVLETDSKKIRILPESKADIENTDLYLLKYDIGNALAKLGTLWSLRDERFFCWNAKTCLDRQSEEKRFTKVNLTHLPFLLQCSENGRLRAVLTGQLRNIRFEIGEKVFVRREEECTGDPLDDLEACSIAKVSNGKVIVNGVGSVTAERIYSHFYLKSLPAWANNMLGTPGFQQLPRDQLIEVQLPEGDVCEGTVQWFGQLPWYDDLTIGIKLTKERENRRDLRFMEYIQLLQCDAGKACMLPFRVVPEHYIGSAEVENFVQEQINDLPIDSHVSFIDKNASSILHGDVRWTGRHRVAFDGMMAVVVMEKRHKHGSNGIFLGQRLVTCNPKRALLIGAEQLIKVEPLAVDDLVQDILQPTLQGHVRKIIPQAKIWANGTVEIELTNEEKTVKKSIYELKKLPDLIITAAGGDRPRGSAVLSVERLGLFWGPRRGIQGAYRDNFFDSLLFCAFAFTDNFVKLLSTASFDSAELLKCEIIHPLRSQYFVSHVQTDELSARMKRNPKRLNWRTNLDDSLKGFFREFLCLEPFVVIGKNDTFEGHYSVTAPPVPSAPQSLQSSQHCLEKAFCEVYGFIKEMPENLILQLTRNEAVSSPIIPALTLDLQLCLQTNQFKRCAVCSVEAQVMFPNLFDKSGLKRTFRCSECAKEIFNPTPLPKSPSVLPEAVVEVTTLDLCAVICRDKDFKEHTTAFVRCGPATDPQWVHFDSVYDQKQSNDGFEFVPHVEKVDVTKWIRTALIKKKLSDNIRGNIYHDLFHNSDCLIYEIRKP